MCMWKLLFGGSIIGLAAVHCALGAAVQGGGDEAQRRAAIADFTAKTKEANYPALFENAAREFNVPADELKGIALAETRWEHLTWPLVELVAPENRMPQPSGIMSQWDNACFRHSLV